MSRTPAGQPRSGGWIINVALVLSVIAMLIVTAINVTHSNAVADARRAYVRGDLVACLERSLDHLDRQPWSHEASLLAARCLSRLDYADLAERYFQHAGHLELNDLQLRAYGLVRGPHAEQAIPVFDEILARSPENVTALRRLAVVELSRDKTAEVLKLADRMCKIESGAVIGHTLRGVVFHNDRNPQEAVAAFERVLKLDPELSAMPLSRSLFWSHLADDLIECGQIDEAARRLTAAISEGNDPELMNRLGRVYFLQGSLEEAERCFRVAVEWGPNDFDPHLSLAKLAMQRQDREAALNHLNEARLRSPRQYTVLYSLASVYRLLGRTADADRVRETLAQVHAESSKGPGGAAWPGYAL